MSLSLLFLLGFLVTLVLSQTGHTTSSWGCDGCPPSTGDNVPTTTVPTGTPTQPPTPTDSPSTGGTTVPTSSPPSTPPSPSPTDGTDQGGDTPTGSTSGTTSGTDGSMKVAAYHRELYACNIAFKDELCTVFYRNTTIHCLSKGSHNVGCDWEKWGLHCEDGVCEETYPYGGCQYQSMVVLGKCQ